MKNFDSFSDRRFFDFGETFEVCVSSQRHAKLRANSLSSFLQNSLDMLMGEQWKRVRSVMTPGLSSGKIKHGEEIFTEKSKIMVEHLKKAAGTKGGTINPTLYVTQ